ncbi:MULTISPECIES: helix-turn-helix transcriptional regulator [Arthrobacter]|uniref:ArsR family transcriptional regulator n=1 Tax=Arthrobacter terricola TaxID=2547396 RepID=A0A4R5KHT8_9MICC|nr:MULTISPECIES: metalloregulator ArsR/SmtB family transcription factor [Arthrobacter]MBT8162145.1 metalloregulator ArsR/SmtB family transcription factor [Arthrobacter sp. GN70]TDF93957.1 ArsR family transcriptional regulator [Arthrobacter terricola]
MVTDDVFAVIAEATRRDILVSLRSGDKAVGELVEELEASQPTISKHLKVLREADLVSMRAQGQKRYYTLNPKPLAGVASWLATFDVGSAKPAVEAPAPESISRSRSVAHPGVSAHSPSRKAHTQPDGEPLVALPAATAVGRLADAAPVAVELPAGADDTVPQQIGRTVGRAATKAADLLANLPNLPTLPKFGRKK